MQTMPDKNRRMVTIGAILVGAVVLGALAFFAFNREEEQPLAQDDTSYVGSALEGETGESVSATSTPITNLNPTNSAAGEDTADAAPDEESAATAPTEEPQSDVLEPEGSAQVTPDSSSTVPSTHVVAEGETLREISEKYYGDPVYAGDIEALNQLSDPNRILVGQVLQLPRPEDLR